MNRPSVGPVLVAIILGANGLLGCGGQSEDGKSEPSGGAQAPTAAAAPVEPVKQAKPDETESVGAVKGSPPNPAADRAAPAPSNFEARRFVVEFHSREGPVGENAYLVIEKKLKQGLIIDPGKRSPELEKAVLESGVAIKAILNTHGHRDHIGANGAYARQYHADVYAHPGDKSLYGTGANQPSRWISAEGDLPIGDMQVRVIYTPGHTAGSVCFLIGENLFSGDTLFKEDIGRTDDEAAERLMVDHIWRKLFILPPGTPVYPGHEDLTSIAAEKKRNPCAEGSRPSK